MGDSTNTAKIENIFLLKLSHFFGIFFFHGIYSSYLKLCIWLCPQKAPPRGQWGTIYPQRWAIIAHDGGHMSHDVGLLVVIMLSKMAIH